MRWYRRSRGLDDFADAIHPELLDTQIPSPGPELIDRIVASRTSGARVILPEVESPRTSRSRLFIPAVVAAGLLLLLVPLRPSSVARSDASSLSRIATDWVSGSAALAQTDGSRTQRTSPPISFARPANLRPVKLEYRRSWRDSNNRDVGHVAGSITVAPVTSNGIPAFLVVSTNQGVRESRDLFTLDSVTISRSGLQLLRHTALTRPYSRYDQITIEQNFRGDTVSGRMRAMTRSRVVAQRPISRVLPASMRPYLLDPLAPVVLGTVKLHKGWAGSASMLGWAVRDDDIFMPVDLRVDGEETATVPAGRFDCWRLTIRFAGRSVSYWIRKSDGVGVRGIEREPGGVTREVVLVR